MSYSHTSRHKINCEDVFKYIQKSEDNTEQFWINNGINKDDIKYLIDMENSELPDYCPLGYYASRQCLLKVGRICIDDVLNDIKDYKLKLEGMDLC